MVQCKSNRLQSLFALLWLQLALPNSDAVLAHSCQFLLLFFIPFLVPANLRHPELPVRLRNLTAK